MKRRMTVPRVRAAMSTPKGLLSRPRKVTSACSALATDSTCGAKRVTLLDRTLHSSLTLTFQAALTQKLALSLQQRGSSLQTFVSSCSREPPLSRTMSDPCYFFLQRHLRTVCETAPMPCRTAGVTTGMGQDITGPWVLHSPERAKLPARSCLFT